MRCRVVFLVLCFGYTFAQKRAVYPKPDKLVEVLPFIFQCADETKISPEVIAEFRAGNTNITDKSLNKFLYCLFYKSGYADKNGHVKVDKCVDFFQDDADKNKLRKVIEECNKEEGSDRTETVSNFIKCFTDKSGLILKL